MHQQGGWAPQNPQGNYASLPPQQSYGSVNPMHFQASPQRKPGDGNLSLLGAPVSSGELQASGSHLPVGHPPGGVRQVTRDPNGLFPGHDQARRASHEALNLSSHLYAQQQQHSQHALSADNNNQYNMLGGFVGPALHKARTPSNQTLTAQQNAMDLYGFQRPSLPPQHGTSNTIPNQRQHLPYDQAQYRGVPAQQYPTTYQVQPLPGHAQYQQQYNQAGHGVAHQQDPARQHYHDSSLFSSQPMAYPGGGHHQAVNEPRHMGAGNRGPLSDHVMMLPLNPRADTYPQGMNYSPPRTMPMILTQARPSASRQVELQSSLSTEEHIKEHFVMSLKDDLKNWVQADDDDRTRKRPKLDDGTTIPEAATGSAPEPVAQNTAAPNSNSAEVQPVPRPDSNRPVAQPQNASQPVHSEQPKLAPSENSNSAKKGSRKRKADVAPTERAVANGAGGVPMQPGTKEKKPRKKKEGDRKKESKKEGVSKRESKKQKAVAAAAEAAPPKQADIRDWVIQKPKGTENTPRPGVKGPDQILCSEELGQTDSESEFAEPRNMKRLHEETEDKKPQLQMPENMNGLEGARGSKEDLKASKPNKEKKEKVKKGKAEMKEIGRTDAMPEGETTEEEEETKRKEKEKETKKGTKGKKAEEGKESKKKEKKKQIKKEEVQVSDGSSTDTAPEIFAQKPPKPPAKRKEKNEKNTKKGKKETEAHVLKDEKSVGVSDKVDRGVEAPVVGAKEEAGTGKGSKKKKKGSKEVKEEQVLDLEVPPPADGAMLAPTDPQPWVPPVPIVDVRREDEDTANPCTEEGNKEAVCEAVASIIKMETSKGGKKKVSVDVDRALSHLDDEDLRFLRLVAMHYPSAEDFGGKKLPFTRQEMIALGAAIPGSGEHQEYVVPKSRQPPHISGSARTEGYYQLTVGAKMANVAAAPIDPVWLNSISVSAQQVAAQKQSGSTRSNRADARYTSGSVSDTQGNMLNKRHKQLRFGRSRIHAVGLYAMEPINVNDMVIEYVGEIIRQHVADTREAAYEKMGIGSSYMFRIDTDEIIDATYKGNVARFINHCCEPNCTAKVITVDNEPRIAIYAKRNIEVGEEITYDYKFPIEEDKIPCHCGAPTCRGSLN